MYGELSPHLKEDTGHLERALLYSGLFGWHGEAYERFGSGSYGFGAAHQVLEGEGDLVNEVISSVFESPSISHISGVGKSLYQGDYTRAVEKGLPWGNLYGQNLVDWLTDDKQ